MDYNKLNENLKTLEKLLENELIELQEVIESKEQNDETIYDITRLLFNETHKTYRYVQQLRYILDKNKDLI